MQLSDYNLCNLYFCRQCTKTLIFLKFCQPALSTLKIHWITEKTLSTCWKSLLVALRWKSSCLFGLYFMIQWTCMLTCICSFHHFVTASCLFTFFFKKDVHTKLQNKQESSNINSSETKVESKDTDIEMVVPEEDGTKSKIKEQGGGHFAPLLAPSVKDKLLSNNIQIKASSQEVHDPWSQILKTFTVVELSI